MHSSFVQAHLWKNFIFGQQNAYFCWSYYLSQKSIIFKVITSFGRKYTYIETMWKEVKWSMKWPYSIQLNQSRNVLFQTHLFYDHIWSYWTLDGSAWRHNYHGYTTSLYLVMYADKVYHFFFCTALTDTIQYENVYAVNVDADF